MANKWAIDDRRQLEGRVNKKLDEFLRAGETIRVIIRSGVWSMVATDRRVFLMKAGVIRHNIASWELGSLSGVEVHTGILTGYVALVGPGLESPTSLEAQFSRHQSPAKIQDQSNVLVFARVGSMEQTVRERVAAIQALIADAHAPQAAAPAAFDPSDQLRKLARLRDEGIITTAEFDAKKAELLSRM